MRTKIVGLTGGIGSGKTTIANYFASMGVPVYIADEEAKKILYRQDLVNEITGAFGKGVLTDNIPDKNKLAAVVFKSKEKLELLNSIIHPKVREHFREWVATKGDAGFVIKEAAILFESGSYKDCDKIILVTAPKEVRIQRVMERDNLERQQVIERMDNQWDDEKKKVLSDYIINNTTLSLARKEANKIVKELRKI